MAAGGVVDNTRAEGSSKLDFRIVDLPTGNQGLSVSVRRRHTGRRRY